MDVTQIGSKAGKTLTMTVKIDDVKSELSDLVARVEASEDVLIARDVTPVARLTLIPSRPDVAAAIAAIKESRVGHETTTVDELLEWRDEGRR